MIDSFLEERVQRHLDAARRPGRVLRALVRRRPTLEARVAGLLAVDEALREAAGRERLLAGAPARARGDEVERPAVLARIGWTGAGLAAAAVAVAAAAAWWPGATPGGTRGADQPLAIAPQPEPEPEPEVLAVAPALSPVGTPVAMRAWNPTAALSQIGAELEAPMRDEWDRLVTDVTRAVSDVPLPRRLPITPEAQIDVMREAV